MGGVTADTGAASADSGTITSDAGGTGGTTADSGILTADSGSVTADSGDSITADSGTITADNGFVTADGSSGNPGLLSDALSGVTVSGTLGSLTQPRASKIIFSTQRPSPDGLYWPNYPQGDHP